MVSKNKNPNKDEYFEIEKKYLKRTQLHFKLSRVVVRSYERQLFLVILADFGR